MDRVLGSMLYLLYTTNLSVALGTTTTIYANDTVILVAPNNSIEAFLHLQESLYIQKWLKNGKSNLMEPNQCI